MDSPDPLRGHTSRLRLVWECFALARFVESGPWWGGQNSLSDDVSHILIWDVSRSLFREMVRGLEIRVLEGANTRFLAGSGCESFGGVRFTGFVDGD